MSVLNAKTTVVVMLAALAFAVCGEGVNLLDLIRESEETPAPGRIRRSNAQIVERVVRREVTNTVVRVVEKPVVVEKQVVVEKPVVVEKKVVVEREVTNTVEKIVEKVVEKPVFVEKKVIVEVPVEKTVVDRQAEEQLMKQLEQERTLNAEVKRTMKRPVDSSRSKQASKITSASTYYDRKN